MKRFVFRSTLSKRCCLAYSSWSKRDKILRSLRETIDKVKAVAGQTAPSPGKVLPRSAAPVVLHGNYTIQDDFAWLQDRNNHEVKRAINKENRYAEYVMADTKNFQETLVKRMSDLSDQIQNIDEAELPVEIGNYHYYTKDCKDYPGLVVHCRRRKSHHSVDNVEEIIFDESSAVGRWSYISVRSMKISPSEKFVAFIVDISGNDEYRGIIINMGKNMQNEICEELPTVNLEWSAADEVLYYTTFDSLKRADKVWRHKLGSNVCEDELIFVEKDERFFVDISCTKDRQFVTVNCNSKSTSEVHVLNTADPNAVSQLVRPRETGIEYYVEHHHGIFCILTNLPDGENYQVMTVRGEDLSSKNWSTLVGPQKEIVLDDMDVFSGYCVLYQKENTLPRISVVPLRKKSSEFKIQLPDSSCVINPGYNLDFNSGILNFTTSSPIQPPTLMELNMETQQLRNLMENGTEKMTRPDFSKYCRSQLYAMSQDGTQVPITIFHKKGIELNGQHPILIHVYGSYGMNVNMDFSAEKFYLLSQDWILAFCHVRGGGELGRSWYHMGRMMSKKKSFEDFEACVRTLQKEKYSSPHLTAVKASSAGALPVAVLCNSAPHLVQAVVLKVPLVDVMSAMLDQGLELTSQEFEEFGNPRLDVDAFNNLKSYCPYLNLSNQDYPNMLLMSSMKDIRVPYWMPLKYIKKLRHIQSKTDSSNHKKMLLLKTDFETGHFGAGIQETSFIYAFLYKALGLSFSK